MQKLETKLDPPVESHASRTFRFGTRMLLLFCISGIILKNAGAMHDESFITDQDGQITNHHNSIYEVDSHALVAIYHSTVGDTQSPGTYQVNWDASGVGEGSLYLSHHRWGCYAISANDAD